MVNSLNRLKVLISSVCMLSITGCNYPAYTQYNIPFEEKDKIKIKEKEQERQFYPSPKNTKKYSKDTHSKLDNSSKKLIPKLKSSELTSSDQIEKANYLLSSGNPHYILNGLNVLRGLANNGDTQAQYLLGSWMLKKTDSQQYTHEGLDWLEKAAENNHPIAQRDLGKYFLGTTNQNTKIDLYLAHHYLQKASLQGDSESKKLLARIYESAALVKNAHESAFKLNLQVAHQRDPEAMYRTAQAYESGLGTEINLKEAFFWYREAANQDHSYSMMHTGIFYHEGKGTPQNISKAKYWHQKAAKKNIAYSQYQYGRLIETKVDTHESIPYYEKAADNGFIPAINRLGDIFYRGIGHPQNNVRAKIYYSQSAQLNNAYGQFQYANILYKDDSIFQHWKKSIKLLTSSAEQGYTPAQSLLGRLYYSPGIKQNYNLARHWLEKAATDNDLFALSALGEIYRYGRGVVPNNKMATDYYERAAKRGHVEAQTFTALSYHQGLGVPQDYKRAIKWYKQAAQMGSPQAQYNLGTLYWKGQGVSQNYITAYAWINLAASNGDPEALTARNHLKVRLSQEQLYQAQTLSSQFRDRANID